MYTAQRRMIASASLIAAIAVVALAAGTVGATGSGRPDTATAYVAITHTVGKTEFAAGNVTDQVFHNSAVTYMISAGTGSKPGTIAVSANPVTVYSSNGAIAGTATATLTVQPNGTATFTAGKIKLTRGTGGQKGHSFVGTFTGSAASATGPYVFHETGTYK